jgi:hypothetical protein
MYAPARTVHAARRHESGARSLDRKQSIPLAEADALARFHPLLRQPHDRDDTRRTYGSWGDVFFIQKSRLRGDFFVGSPEYLFTELFRIYPMVRVSMEKMERLAFLKS